MKTTTKLMLVGLMYGLKILSPCLITFNSFAQWTQQGSDIDGEAALDRSGISVSMPDVNTVAIGANRNAGTGTNAGHVRVYTWDGSSWMQKGADIDGEAAEDYSGTSVSMPDANTVAIGATQNDGTGSNSGHVRIYTWNGSAWTQKGSDIDGEAANDWSGTSVSMPDANTVAIGAPYNGGIGAGHVRIYTWNGSDWIQQGNDIDGEAGNDWSGTSVSMPDANTVAIGAPKNNGTAADAGHVRIYSWDGSAWLQKGSDIDGEAIWDYSGKSVSMPDANTVAIGAYLNDGNVINSNTGHVRIYTWNGSDWIQQGNDIDGEAAGDSFGWSVSMPDANTVAIGAIGNNENGLDAGHVRIYTWNGSAWTQKGSDIDGETAYDSFGWSVSMPDANTVAIGAYLNDGNGSNAGHVRVYSYSVATPVQLLTFDATPAKDNNGKYYVRCNWSTATEINNDYFTVERSQDGKTFSHIGKVDGAGNSSNTLYYEFDDQLPYTGLSYYRHKQTDYDGKFSYSNIVAVYIGEMDIINISPSPAEKEIEYSIIISETSLAQVKVINVLGQAVINQTETIEKGVTQKKIDISMLASGYYMLSINAGQLGTTQKKFAVK